MSNEFQSLRINEDPFHKELVSGWVHDVFRFLNIEVFIEVSLVFCF